MQHLPRRWQGRARTPVPPAPGRVFRLARAGRGMNVSHVRRLLSPVIAIVPRCGQASHPEQSKTSPPASMQAASPCTWAAAVCQHVCSKRNETRRARPPACGAGARLYGAEGIGCRYCRHAGGQPSARGVGACSSAVQTQEVDSKTGEGAAAGRTGYAIESNEKSPALQVPVGRRPPRPRSLGSPATAPLASMTPKPRSSSSQAPKVSGQQTRLYLLADF